MANSLPLSENIVLDHRYFLGSLMDYSRYSNHGVGTGFHWEKRPDTHARFSDSDLITVADSPELQLTDLTIIAYGDFDKFTVADRLVSKRDGGGVNYDIYFQSTTNINLYDGANDRTTVINWAGAKMVAMSCISGDIGKAYVDGAFVSNLNAANTITENDAPVIIGNLYTGGTNPLTTPLKGVIIYNTVLTDAQIAQVYEWTLETTSPTFKKKNFYVPSQITGREDGLVAAWDMENVGQKIIDKTGNGNDGTITQGMQKKANSGMSAMEFIQPLSQIAITDSDGFSFTGPRTLRFRGVKFNDASNVGSNLAGKDDQPGDVADREWGLGIFLSNKIRFFLKGALNGTTQIGRETGAVLVDNQEYEIVVTYDGGTLAAGIKIYIDGNQADTTDSVVGVFTGAVAGSRPIQLGNRGLTRTTTVLNGEIGTFEIYTREFTGTEIASDYRTEYATLPYYVGDFKDANVSVTNDTSGWVSNTDYRIDSGEWKVAEDSTGSYIECVSAGIIYRQNYNAYGTWEYSFYRTSGLIYIFIVAETLGLEVVGQYSYNFLISANGALFLRKVTNGGVVTLFNTHNGYIEDNTKYGFKVTRRYDGQMTVYIKGGSFDEYTLVDPTGGLGTNPVTSTTHTTSKYITCLLRLGDKIYLDSQYQGVV